ncbi:pyrimidine/purine nucleoside phosphorylase [Colwelliaceae bacterium 6441]
MSEFNNVTVGIAANVYFDGKVTSRKVTFADGSYKTLGIMMPGEYQFGTEAAELMEITSGELLILLPESEQWQLIKGGESFNVDANVSFKVKANTLVDYCCSYL